MSDDLGKLGEFFYKSSYDEFEFVIDALSLKRKRRKDPLGQSAPVKKVPVSILKVIISRLYGYDKDESLLTIRLIAGEIYQKRNSRLSWQGCRIACISDCTGEVPRRLTRTGVEVEEKYRRAFYYHVYDSSQRISSDMTEEIRKAKTAEREMTGEEEKPTEFVVLNESRKEYIVTNHQDFTKVILSLICWSDDPSVSMRTNYEIYRGRWAWNRISIFPQDEFEPVAAEFKDITKRVYKHVRKIVNEDTRGRISF
ncbi:hypothetical protein EV182_004377 [Spiromyces aspiralis]|uniref:Uncharacterized protein n=1 Tax=Spiromyces aspiralis TaxID=68401 RepID=A0ACC1HIZ2_9FUNG|nr:hypothetical protein EV182_004377 [Spiromyces aspiralis]